MDETVKKAYINRILRERDEARAEAKAAVIAHAELLLVHSKILLELSAARSMDEN